MGKLYLLPGLGADYRIYQNIDLKGCDVVNVEWLEPEKQDTLSTYAQKLIDKYHIKPHSILIGNSLGGMLSIEIAKKIEIDKVILISSIKTINEAPLSFRLYKHIPLYHIVLTKLMGAVRLIIRLAFGKMSKIEEDLFVSMLKKTSPVFIQWAKKAILNWDNQTIPPNVYHIHGDHDNVLPHKRIKDVTIIKGGTHIMIFDRAKEINAWLKGVLST
jgi:pimeloyl-ACP methyl ester carboxylesterase